jgi:hypothetical protein
LRRIGAWSAAWRFPARLTFFVVIPSKRLLRSEGSGRAARRLAIYEPGNNRASGSHPLKIVILRSLLLATKDLGAPCEGLAFHERGANRTSGAHPYQTQKAQPAAAPSFPSLFSE